MTSDTDSNGMLLNPPCSGQANKINEQVWRCNFNLFDLLVILLIWKLHKEACNTHNSNIKSMDIFFVQFSTLCCKISGQVHVNEEDMSIYCVKIFKWLLEYIIFIIWYDVIFVLISELLIFCHHMASLKF